MPSTVVFLGTGGTIAGASADATDSIGYAAAQRSLLELLADLQSLVPALSRTAIEAEQVAQIDSKDMGPAVWQLLAGRVAHHLARPEVAGLVITHGTDTLEETAWLLQRVLAPTKPVVLVAAMRPATALSADGPQNLLDALAVARTTGARGVLAVLAGRVHSAGDLRKVHPHRLDAFDSGDAGPLGVVEAVGCGAFANGPQAPRWAWACWTRTRRCGLGSRSSPAMVVHVPKPWRRCAPPGCRVWWWRARAMARCTIRWRSRSTRPSLPDCRCGAARAAPVACWSGLMPGRLPRCRLGRPG